MEAVALLNGLRPELLDNDQCLLFHLRQQHLIKLVREGRTKEAFCYAQDHLSGGLSGGKELFLDWLRSRLRVWLRPRLRERLCSPSELSHLGRRLRLRLRPWLFCGARPRSSSMFLRRIRQSLVPAACSPPHTRHFGWHWCPSIGLFAPHCLQVLAPGVGQTSTLSENATRLPAARAPML
ncbi:uncharacterized protein [Dermacentor albipictus]|uniref:uncharacterized protein n=1 Tax=Dermacentor albipictus TaxID=60249 RepID=UPI0038FCD5F1